MPIDFQDYSDAERAAIEHAAPRPLTDTEWYLLRTVPTELLRRKARGKKQGTWSRALVALCRQTEDQLAKLTVGELILMPDGMVGAPFESEYRALVSALQCLRNRVEKAESDAEARRARKLAELGAKCPDALSLVAGRKSSSGRVVYQRFVLTMWTRLGGNLTHGKNQEQVDGPTWRFFEAVVRPVMGKYTPKRSGFPDIVRRHKREQIATSAYLEFLEVRDFDGQYLLLPQRLGRNEWRLGYSRLRWTRTMR